MEHNPARAFDFYLQAAQNNDPIGERLLALAFRDGIGTPPRQDEFVAWLNRASQHGDAEAMYLLSEVYADGQGGSRRTKVAVVSL